MIVELTESERRLLRSKWAGDSMMGPEPMFDAVERILAQRAVATTLTSPAVAAVVCDWLDRVVALANEWATNDKYIFGVDYAAQLRTALDGEQP